MHKHGQICQAMLDSYMVSIGEKHKLTGEGFDALRSYTDSEDRFRTSSITIDVDPTNDETRVDSQQADFNRKRRFSKK